MSVVNEIEQMISEDNESRKKLDFMGTVPCPIKPAFKECYDEFEKDYFNETGKQFFSYVPSSCSYTTDLQRKLSNILAATSVDELPDIGVTFGMGDYCNSKIIENYIKKGSFKSVFDVDSCDFLKDTGLKDKYDAYTTIGIFAMVIMIDKKKMKDLPVPKTWDDLLDPVYKDSICISGGHGDVGTLYPMYVYKEQGDVGLSKLENNVFNVLHGSKMAMVAGTNSSEAAPIYVIPWFFGKACAKNDDIEIIWPEEGAYIEPLIMMVKKDIPEELNRIVEFMTGDRTAKIIADNYFISTYPGIDNRLPNGAKLKWIGWDYIFENPVEKFKEKVQQIYGKYVK